ncbi:MAG: alpha/beta hydrolase [Alcanivoracaceae bacterium]|nr:alpha/beta hydrolase [Alcanivoracaceae bacterium]
MTTDVVQEPPTLTLKVEQYLHDTADGSVIKVHRVRAPAPSSRQTVVLINAPGMPAEFFSRLFDSLSPDHDVLTWETRGVPNYDLAFDENNISLDVQLGDLLEVLAREQVDRCHLVGWCGGAQLALMLANRDDVTVESMTLLNGMFNLDEELAPRTEFESQLRSLLPGIARSRRYSHIFHNLLFGASASSQQSNDGDKQTKSDVYRIMMDRPPEVLLLSSRSMETVESTYRFARVTNEYFKRDMRSLAAKVRCPTLVLTGDQDREANPDESAHISALLPDSEFQRAPTLNHYSLYTSGAIAETVSSFLARQADRQGARP